MLLSIVITFSMQYTIHPPMQEKASPMDLLNCASSLKRLEGYVALFPRSLSLLPLHVTHYDDDIRQH